MNQFKAALFDLDGTLVETESQYTIFWGNTSRQYRPDIPRLEYLIKGTTLVQIFDRYFPNPEWQEKITRGLDEFEGQMKFPFIPGAIEFLRDLKSHGVKLAVVTSSNKKKMDVAMRAIPEMMSLFDRILTSEDFAASKPNPDCYLKGAEVFGCSTDECIVFEDAFTGLQAGMSSGILTIGVATYNGRDAIQDKCHHVIDNFEGLTYDGVAELLSNRNKQNGK